MKSDLSVYISSFDGCSDLWHPFFDLFERFWGDCHFPVHLVNNSIQYVRHNVSVIHTGEERNWFYRTIQSLEAISEKYILFMLEDYFLSKKVNNDDVDALVQHMDENNLYYCRLSNSYLRSKGKSLISVPADTRYAVSLQPAIWNRVHLLQLLKEIDKKSPWEFEQYLEENLKADGAFFEGICYDTRDILGYKNAVLRGKWMPGTVKFYSKMGYSIDLGTRQMLPKSNWIKYRIAVSGRKLIPKWLQGGVKSILRAFGFKYV